MKMHQSLSIAACLFGLVVAAPAMSQVNMGTFARDPMAPLAGAMTEAQARKACRTQMQGAKSESRTARSKRMEICMRDRMNGN